VTPEQLFQKTAQDELPAVVYLYGDDAYLRREWSKLAQKKGFEIVTRDLKKKGVEEADEDLSCGTSLFVTRSVAWVQSQLPFHKWSKESARVWERMEKRADGQSLVLVVQGPSFSEKRAMRADEFVFETERGRWAAWIKRMNEVRGAGLSSERLFFLESQDADLLSLDNWVELWSLGGDAWAKEALGWGVPTAPGESVTTGNPAFEWVDALISGDRPVALARLKELQRQGEDPLRLLGLLNRSLKVMVAIESGAAVPPEAPFLIDKVRRLNKKNPPTASGRGIRLLAIASQADVWLKSRPVDGDALLVRLSQEA